MEKIATSFCSFEALRKRYTYVDKTDMLWRLVSDSDDRLFFIARPRRFGKSLMLDTLKCIFEGRRELFKGLKIDKKRYDWEKYPVVKLSMDEVKGETPDHLIENLIGTVAAEDGSAFGYADAIIETKSFVWVFEFKFNKSAKAAIRQIRDKGYADQYKGDSRPVTLVGVNFRRAKRNIDEPLFAAL